MRSIWRSWIVLLATSLIAQAGPVGWGDLSSWKDSYPVQNAPAPPKALLKDPLVRAALVKMLATADMLSISSYTAMSKDEFVDGYLIVAQCKPHDCGSENAVIVLEQNSDNVWVRLNEASNRAVSTRWYGNHSGFMQLPESVRTKVAAKFNAE